MAGGLISGAFLGFSSLSEDRGRLPLISPQRRKRSHVPSSARILTFPLTLKSLANQSAWLNRVRTEGASGTRDSYECPCMVFVMVREKNVLQETLTNYDSSPDICGDCIPAVFHSDPCGGRWFRNTKLCLIPTRQK